ncbi:hypothetical protein GJAV_G00006670 [Gymnothorax javanicus]|nr:hypothetical protein GJAV_G00006670 [Gymnothorax javanicus]
MEMQRMTQPEETSQEEKKGREEENPEDEKLVEEKKVESEYSELRKPAEDIYSEATFPHASATTLKDLQRRARRYLLLCMFLSVLSLLLLIGVCILLAARQSPSGCHDERVMEGKKDNDLQLSPPTCSLKECQHICPRKDHQARPCRKCDAGWLEYKGSCFYLSREMFSWDEGREKCKKMAGDLAIIDDQIQQEFLIMNGNLAYWIGMVKTKTGETVWVNATVGESYWTAGQKEGKCGFLVGRGSPPHRVHESPCSHQAAFICQK